MLGRLLGDLGGYFGRFRGSAREILGRKNSQKLNNELSKIFKTIYTLLGE